jgi:hypothetical protein
MPKRSTLQRARRDESEGKSASTQAGEFVREEIHHIREGKHGARSAKQAIAIGLSKARAAGVALPPKPGGKATVNRRTRKRNGETSARRARATLATLEKEPRSSASPTALSRHAHQSAVARGPARLHAAAMKAVATKGAAGRHKAAQKAAATRKRAP